MVSTYDVNDGCLRDSPEGKAKVVTFSMCLRDGAFPLLSRQSYADEGRTMQRPVEMKFARHIDGRRVHEGRNYATDTSYNRPQDDCDEDSVAP